MLTSGPASIPLPPSSPTFGRDRRGTLTKPGTARAVGRSGFRAKAAKTAAARSATFTTPGRGIPRLPRTLRYDPVVTTRRRGNKSGRAPEAPRSRPRAGSAREDSTIARHAASPEAVTQATGRLHVPASTTGGNLGAERLEQLRELLPEAFLEGVLDPLALRNAVGGSRDADERYQLRWVGKEDAIFRVHLASVGTLAPMASESIDFEETQNVFIEGENLEVLKLLYRLYYARVRIVYVDPPYNTEKDRMYVDDYAAPLSSYLQKIGQKSADGTLLTSNPETSGRLHSAWLTMLYPRLVMARQLLVDDGVLLVSCNDKEQAQLKLLRNEIFGEDNWVSTFVWHNEGNIDNQSKIKTNHEFIRVRTNQSKNEQVSADLRRRDRRTLHIDQRCRDRKWMKFQESSPALY
jgi:hypothetical protein